MKVLLALIGLLSLVSGVANAQGMANNITEFMDGKWLETPPLDPRTAEKSYITDKCSLLVSAPVVLNNGLLLDLILVERDGANSHRVWIGVRDSQPTFLYGVDMKPEGDAQLFAGCAEKAKGLPAAVRAKFHGFAGVR